MVENPPVLTGFEPGASDAQGHPAIGVIGRFIGPYELIGVLGEGGMGTVYRARQHVPVKRDVALKVVKDGLASAGAVARFEAERQALALMDHPNIARVFDAGSTSEGQPYFVMELVDGAPVTTYCATRNLAVRERLSLFVDICRAIQHAHLKGIIHRDIKPSNILVMSVDGHPVPKVIDFGVVKATGQKLTDDTLSTQVGVIMGTLDYMSPEQAGAGTAGVDSRSDVYALGAVLYELLTGATPFARNGLQRAAVYEILRTIREDEPPKPSTRLMRVASKQVSSDTTIIERDVRGELDWIAMKALSKDPFRRYQSADLLAQDIEHFLHGRPVDASPDSHMYRIRKFIGRNRFATASICAVTASLVLGLCAALWQARRATLAETDAELKQAAAESAKQISDQRLTELKRTAPTFLALARSLRDEGKLNEAIEKLGYAIQLDPEDSGSALAMANLHQATQNLPAAITGYRRVQGLRPDDAAARMNLALCEDLLRQNGGTVPLQRPIQLKLLAALRDQNRLIEAAPLSAILEPDLALSEATLRARMRAFRGQAGWRDDRVSRQADGTFQVDLKDLELSGLAELKGLPISALILDNGKLPETNELASLPLTSLSIKGSTLVKLGQYIAQLKLRRLDVSNTVFNEDMSLLNMPLEWLDLSATRVASVPYLEAAVLTHLNLSGSRVVNLAELSRYKKLQTLNVSQLAIRTLEPLASLKLREFDCSYTRIEDISALNGMPLRKLNLGGTRVKDLARVCAFRQLEELVVPADVPLPDGLRTLPALTSIAIGDARQKLPSAEFWKEYDAAQKVASARAMIMERLAKIRALRGWQDTHLKDLPDGTFSLTLAMMPVSDLNGLRGLPISEINLSNTAVDDISFMADLPVKHVLLCRMPKLKDISPLRDKKLTHLILNRSGGVSDISVAAGMPLVGVDLLGTGVTDLSPLVGAPLDHLKISKTPVVDLSPLNGMGITILEMSRCGKVVDFSPLAKLPNLKSLVIDNNLAFNDLSVLARHPINYLDCTACPISDVSALRGLPIHSLSLGGTQVADLSPLAECAQLEQIGLPPNAKNVDVLRKLQHLMYISDSSGAKSAADFWKQYDQR